MVHLAAGCVNTLTQRIRDTISAAGKQQLFILRSYFSSSHFKTVTKGFQTHLSTVFGRGSAFAMAGHLPGWNHTYLLYWHAAVSEQHSSVTPTVLPVGRACPSSDPCPCQRSAVPSTSCSPGKLLRNDCLFSVQTASSRSVAMEWDQIAVATRLWRRWGVRLS